MTSSIVTFLFSSLFGLFFNHILTHPRSRINKNLPKIKFKAFQLSPCINISLRTKTIRIHHWITYSLLLIITITFGGGFFNNIIVNGYFVGGIAQGLSFPDWKNVVYRKQ